MRPTNFIGLLGLVVIGIMLADILTHPQGTSAAANGLVALTVPTEAALLGRTPSGYS